MNPLELAKALTREVRTGERDGQPTKIAIARRSYPAEQADVWDALTSIERLPRWFLPVSGELKIGGRYQFEGNAGGTVETCRPPELIKSTWEFGDQVSWLEIRLSPEGDRTAVELIHEAHVDPEFAKQYGPGAVGVGWDGAFLGLGLHLESGADRPDDLVAWTTSPEGLEFHRFACDDWARADIEDGTDPAEAKAAADATFAFYTTVPVEQA
ncbi:SRPBCC family protein [Microlunatus speluncae]|uniref:SRPBCC family protein n=1 Tax=Microlunatus speluncae TaxID=2594267 RepID=UPI001266124B|nr:SRPBCC family protein [Microlunatus speluncae]